MTDTPKDERAFQRQLGWPDFLYAGIRQRGPAVVCTPHGHAVGSGWEGSVVSTQHGYALKAKETHDDA